MIRAISTIRSSNSKRDYELRKLHESLSKRIRVIRSSDHKVQCSNLKVQSIIMIRAIRSRSIFVVLIIKFKVQTSKFNGNSYFTV